MNYKLLNKNQKGFEMIGLLFVVVIIGIIGFTSFKVWSNSQTKKENSSTTATVVKTTAIPTVINTKADLTKASKALDTSETQINSQVNGNSLNGDISDLL
jgi:Tfp pilus assembly protein PilE